MSRVLGMLGGLVALGDLLLQTRLRFRGAYWSWRMHTAFGRGVPPRGELVRGVLEYGAWAWRLRRLR